MQLNGTAFPEATRTPHGGDGRYQSIDEVLSDPTLDVLQKRAILSSWASDLFAVESCPWLREIPGIKAPLRVGDIFAALRTLDDEPPPDGGACIRMMPRMPRLIDTRIAARPHTTAATAGERRRAL